MFKKEISLYFDYKSPFAYLAKDEAYRIEKEYNIELLWKPFILNIFSVFGSVEERSERQWAKVKYLYMDARRIANKRGILVKGPKKIFDSSLVSSASLYMQKLDNFRSFHDEVFDRFWKRELDIENKNAINDLVKNHSGSISDFEQYLNQDAPLKLTKLRTEAESLGVFGVPSFVFESEIFWGYDRIPFLIERLEEKGIHKI